MADKLFCEVSINEFFQPRERFFPNDHGVALARPRKPQNFLGRSAPIYEVAIMGFDCIA
ncbi:MAG: hypothetical protein WA857_03705 [Candidatus Acidiferrum sp.]